MSMTENQAMSDERLADLRRDVMSQVASAGGSTRHSDAYAEMLDEINRLRAENERLECGMCGGEMSRNPHAEAGLVARLSDVGAVWECIPCAVGGRSKAYWRAVSAEADNDRLRAENERLVTHLHGEHYCQHEL